MRKRKKENKEDAFVDKEYIKNCLKLNPIQRLKKLESLNNFLFEAMPEESRRSWDMLKKSGF